MAIRPKTLFASISPVILGLSVAYVETNHLNLIIATLTLSCALLMQIASNLANDYLDSQKGIDTEDRLGPIRVTHAGLIEAKTMKHALIFVMIMAFIIGIYLIWSGGPFIALTGLLSLYFAYGYSGGPFPLSSNGLGEVAAFLFFGVLAVGGTTYLQTHQFSALSFILGMGPGFISATILAINNLRDIKTDSETNKRTLAVRFGESFQRKLCIIMIFLSSVILFVIGINYHYTWLLPVSALPLPFMSNWMHISKKMIDKSMNKALAKTALYLLFYCLLSSFAILISSGKIL